jgi:precorrin isomerase
LKLGFFFVFLTATKKHEESTKKHKEFLQRHEEPQRTTKKFSSSHEETRKVAKIFCKIEKVFCTLLLQKNAKTALFEILWHTPKRETDNSSVVGGKCPHK